ncbi:MAG TPA: cyclase family protein [Oceanobacillus sp.]|nr:cyclase family protein [Oceanobacillus sp.]
MCSPVVERIVRERIAKEGRPQISRRNLLKFGGMTAAGLAAASLVSPIKRASAQEISGVIDLSHIFSTDMPTYLPGETPTREDFVTVENDGFYIQRWNYTEHAGTHVDIPAHFVSDGETVDRYPPALLVSPAVVIDISAKAEENPDATLDVEDIEAWESANGEIPLGAVVFMYSGWESRWSDVEAFRNADEDGVMHFPGFSLEAATFLLEERDIHGIGVDTLSLDPGPSSTFDVHLTVLGAGKYGIEGVANLANLMEHPEAMVVAGVPRWEEGSGGPCRLLAII